MALFLLTLQCRQFMLFGLVWVMLFGLVLNSSPHLSQSKINFFDVDRKISCGWEVFFGENAWMICSPKLPANVFGKHIWQVFEPHILLLEQKWHHACFSVTATKLMWKWWSHVWQWNQYLVLEDSLTSLGCNWFLDRDHCDTFWLSYDANDFEKQNVQLVSRHNLRPEQYGHQHPVLNLFGLVVNSWPHSPQ